MGLKILDPKHHSVVSFKENESLNIGLGFKILISPDSFLEAPKMRLSKANIKPGEGSSGSNHASIDFVVPIKSVVVGLVESLEGGGSSKVIRTGETTSINTAGKVGSPWNDRSQCGLSA